MSDNTLCFLLVLVICAGGCVMAWIERPRGGGGS